MSPAPPTSPAADEDDPWALSLVVRVERPGHGPGPPARTDALVAAARAVVALLTDPRTTDPGGELHEAVQRWRAGRIRKIVRRARGARWERTAGLAHVEVTAGSAVVRAFAPHRRDDAPRPLHDLQVGGLELTDPDGWAAPSAPAPALTVRLLPGVAMSAGKALAQVGHAAQLALEDLRADRLDDERPDDERPGGVVAAWLAAGTGVQVLTGAPVLPPDRRVDVRDGGLTEVAPGTLTASAGFEG